MTLDDVKGFIKEKGLDSKSQNRDLVLQRHYLAAYMYWKLNMDIYEVGKVLGKQYHSIRSNLITAHSIQNHPEFIGYNEELRVRIPMKIPQYKDNKALPKTVVDVFELTVRLTRKEFDLYVDANYSKDTIYRLLFNSFLNHVDKNKSVKIGSSYQKIKRNGKD